MKVLIINGSPHESGTISSAINTVLVQLGKYNIETDIINVGKNAVYGCQACGACKNLKKCKYDDIVNILAEKMLTADGVIITSPVYYAGPNGALKAVLDRLFYCFKYIYDGPFVEKVGACIVAARRAGTTSAFNDLNNYFTHDGFTLANGTYWTGIFGSASKEEGDMDFEAHQQIRTVVDNMAFLMKSIELGKKEYGLPEREKKIRTDFFNKNV